MTSRNPHESTSESGSSRSLAPASIDEDSRTPEARLLARRRLGTAYLEDVRALIERAENAEAMVVDLLRERNAGGERREFGTIRTTEIRE